MNLLTQNSKLKKDNIHNFDIPAYKSNTGLITCPHAKDCIANCYARQGTYQFSNVKAKHEANLAATFQDDFADKMITEIKSKRVKILRIHSSGDFYSKNYAMIWLKIINNCPEVIFYAYTKSWVFFNGINLPNNFKLIQSEGGKMAIDKTKAHAIVYTKESKIPKGYKNASDSDLVAVNNKNIFLRYHGNKKANNNGFVHE